MKYTLSLLLLIISLAACQQSPPSPPLTDWRFGVIESYESPADATALGASWTRVRFHWATVQAGGASTWTPSVSDEQIEAELAAGRDIIGLLIATPDWARDTNLLPQGLWLSHDDPNNVWANFVREAVTRYAGKIDHWIIWNEPDIWDKNTPGHTWDGDETDFAQLMRVAYLTAKEANPASVIHLAAMTYYWDTQFGRTLYLDRLLDVLDADPQAAAHHHYFDIMTAHLYFQPEAIYDILTTFHDIVTTHHLDKPIWLVETNAPPVDDPSWPVDSVTLHVTLAEQAAYPPQVIASAFAAGAERLAIYKLHDLDSDYGANPEPFGLIRLDGTHRPAFTTAQVAYQYLAGTLSADRQRWDDVGQIKLTQADRTTTVVFSRAPGPRQATIPATANTARVVNMWGEEMPALTAQNGVFLVELPPAICNQFIGPYCMIGSETFYIIQALEGNDLPTGLPAPLTQATPLQ